MYIVILNHVFIYLGTGKFVGIESVEILQLGTPNVEIMLKNKNTIIIF